MPDMRGMRPGLICDLFLLRRRYDDEQHGIKRQSDDHDITDEDAAMFRRMRASKEVSA